MLLRLPLLTKRICSTTAPRAFPIQLSPHRMSSSSAPNTTPADQLAAGGETDHGLASQMQPQRLQLVKDILDVSSTQHSYARFDVEPLPFFTGNRRACADVVATFAFSVLHSHIVRLSRDFLCML